MLLNLPLLYMTSAVSSHLFSYLLYLNVTCVIHIGTSVHV